MSTQGKIPDAWDDDWVSKADSSIVSSDPLPSNTKLTKAEKRAKQAEFNKQLWADAETQKDSYFLNSRGDVPLKSEFRPTMKVLSRKPMSKAAGTGNNVLDLEQPTLDDEEDDDEDESQRNVLTMEERQRKAQREREEKQKKYEEARQRLFGSEATGGAQSPSRSTLSLIQQSGEPRSRSKTKGSWDSRPSSASNKARHLYDPNYTVKPDSVYVQKKEHESLSGRSTPIEQQPIRSPRGPDNTGRGGFGFAARGSKSG